MTKEKTIDFNSEVDKVDFMYERMFWLEYTLKQAEDKWNELKNIKIKADEKRN